MARARNIKPSFFTNDKLAELAPLSRLLFVGLWTLADREGRLEDRPVKIRAEVLPYDNCNVEKMLGSLSSQGFIVRYANGEKKYIQILAFKKHQNPHVKEAASTIPAPDEHGSSTIQVPEIPAPARLIPDSGFPQPDSPFLIPPSGGKTHPRANGAATAASGFQTFWSDYPKKVAKGRAEKAWNKLKPDIELQARILAAIEAAKRSRDWLKDAGQYIPHPASWLNDKGWEDDRGPARSSMDVGQVV